MKQTKERYIELDLIRVVCCAAVLLYHLGILAGGFFAVCAFFVFSGFLGVKSALGAERFSILRYWGSRLRRVYLPLLATVLVTVLVVSLISRIRWLNLKPETVSVLLGYNNFWQISASQDYFARHGDSPFIHFWFIAILLQFELVFPLLFAALRLTGRKISKLLACIIPLALGAASFAFFYRLIAEGRITEAYYHTAARVFAPLLGIAVGLAEHYYGPLVPKRLRKGSASLIVLAVWLAAFIFINAALDSGFKYLAWAFLAAALISARMASYSCLRVSGHEKPGKGGLLAFTADRSYEIYLVQYPIIFVAGELLSGRLDERLVTAVIIAAVLAAAFLLHYGLSFKKGKKPAALRIAVLAAIVLAAGAGAYYFSVAEDHTREMAELERRLEENAREMQARQDEAASRSRSEEVRWSELLASFDGGEEKVLQAVREMRVVCIGDSVMLGALDGLMETFPNGWFDAQKSRTAWVLPGEIGDLKSSGMLGDAVVINFGANGDCPLSVKERVMDLMPDCAVFWITNTNPKTEYANDSIKELAKKYDNLTIIDWKALSRKHSEYFYADGIHLTEAGRKAYCAAVLDAVSRPYLEEWRSRKAAAEAEYEMYRSQMVSFYGNDMLTNVYTQIRSDYPHASFNTYSKFDLATLEEDIRSASAGMTLADRVVLLLDGTVKLSKDDLKQISELCAGRRLYLITPGRTSTVAADGSLKHTARWKPESGSLYMADGIHLSEQANLELRRVLLDLGLVSGQ